MFSNWPVLLILLEISGTVYFSLSPSRVLSKTSRNVENHTIYVVKWKVKVLVPQLCLTLCDLMDYSPPVSSVHGILQARILEYISSPFSTDLPDPGIEPRLLHCRQIIYCLSLQGSPLKVLQTAKRISRPFMLNQHGSNPALPLTCCKTLGSDITSPNLDFHIY